jgi:hypothetical protein
MSKCAPCTQQKRCQMHASASMQQQQYLQKVHVCAGSATCSSTTAVASIAAAAAAGSADGTATAVSSVSESTAGDASAVAAAVAADTVVVPLVNTASSSGCMYWTQVC